MRKENKKLNSIVHKIATAKVIVITLVAFLIVMVMVNLVLKQNFNYLTQTFNYTPEYAYQLLNNIGEAGRSSHMLIFLPDILMVLLYTVLLVGANYSIFNRLIKSCFAISAITFSPLLLSIIQLAEITILAIILLQYPNQLYSLVQVANIITMAKTILTIAFFLTPLVGLCVMVINKMVKKV